MIKRTDSNRRLVRLDSTRASWPAMTRTSRGTPPLPKSPPTTPSTRQLRLHRQRKHCTHINVNNRHLYLSRFPGDTPLHPPTRTVPTIFRAGTPTFGFTEPALMNASSVAALYEFRNGQFLGPVCRRAAIGGRRFCPSTPASPMAVPGPRPP